LRVQDLVVYVALVAAATVSFCIALVEATYLTVKRPSLFSMQKGGSRKAAKALKITEGKAKLVSVTTFIDTVANVILVTTMGIVLSELFGPLGWIVSVFIGSLLIMIFLSLVPKTIAVENPVKMAVALSPATLATINAMSPVAGPLAGFAKRIAALTGGRRVYREDEISEELESAIDMLETDSRFGPDAGRMIRTTLASSRYTVLDLATSTDKIVSVEADATVLEALKVMGSSHHPRIPVFDKKKEEFVGVVTFRSLSRGISEDGVGGKTSKYLVQPATVEADASVAAAMDSMSSAGVTIAFVYQDGKMIGVITITDLLECILGFKLA
jgi:magnesium and cobalt exporter, CNNM family